MVALVVTVWVATACTHDPEETRGRPRGRLEALGDQWFASQATITYRTTEREPGDPTSPHQCLRQLVGGEVDRQTGLRICSGVGELRLVWAPPDRWRMDEVSPRRSVTLVSTPDRYVRCEREGTDASACVDAVRYGPFGPLVEAPSLLLDEIGARRERAVTALAARTIAGIRSECYRAQAGSAGATDRVEWCFSRGGLLLFLRDDVEGGRVTTAEATAVSGSVADGDLVLPPL